MKKSLQKGRTLELIRDAAKRTLCNKDCCILINTRPAFDNKKSMVCCCGECLLYMSVMQGLRKAKAKKKQVWEPLKISLGTQMLSDLISMLLKGIGSSAQILFFSFTIFLPFNLLNYLVKDTKNTQEIQRGVGMLTVEQVWQTANHPLPSDLPRPSNIKVIKLTP